VALTKVTAGLITANAVVDSFGTQSITGDKIGLTAINANNIVNSSITVDKVAFGAVLNNANAAFVRANNSLDANNGGTIAGTVTFSYPAVFSNTTTIQQTLETTTINVSAAGGTTNFDVLTSPVIYYTANCASNVTLNFRGSSTRTLDSVMSTGQALSVAFVNTQLSANTFLTAAHQIDGFGRSVYWQGGSTPTGGNAASLDVYGYTIIKTASNTFTILASQTQYK
jgi:hypothetical protein